MFYTTTPLSVYLTMLRTGELNLGNLALLRVRTNVVIGPRDVVRRLHTEGEIGAPVAFARSRGNAYLVWGEIRRGFVVWPICYGRTWSRSCRIPIPRPRATACTGRRCSRRRGFGIIFGGGVGAIIDAHTDAHRIYPHTIKVPMCIPGRENEAPDVTFPDSRQEGSSKSEDS